MINHAMLANREHFNEFTSALRVMCQGNSTVGTDHGCDVQLRDGSIRRVYFEVATEGENVLFRTKDWDMVWNPDGSSCTSHSYDIISFGIDIRAK
jgi:hypothetical protein